MVTTEEGKEGWLDAGLKQRVWEDEHEGKEDPSAQAGEPVHQEKTSQSEEKD